MCELTELQRIVIYNMKHASQVAKTGRLYEIRLEAKGRFKAYKTILRQLRRVQKSVSV